MLDAAGRAWAKVNEFVKRVTDLEGESDETKAEVVHLKRDIALIHKEMNHSDKIQAHQGKTIVELEQRIKKLESEKRSKSISAGIAKKQVEKLREELKGSKDPKRRH